jgi:hypothetical protein
LESGAGIILNVNCGPLGLKEELSSSADAEAIIRCAGALANFDRVFVNYVFIGLGKALFVINIPAQSLEEGVKELTADLSFIVAAGFVGIPVTLKTVDEIKY